MNDGVSRLSFGEVKVSRYTFCGSWPCLAVGFVQAMDPPVEAMGTVKRVAMVIEDSTSRLNLPETELLIGS